MRRSWFLVMHHRSHPTEPHVHKALLEVLHIRINCTVSLHHHIRYYRAVYGNLYYVWHRSMISVGRHAQCITKIQLLRTE